MRSTSRGRGRRLDGALSTLAFAALGLACGKEGGPSITREVVAAVKEKAPHPAEPPADLVFDSITLPPKDCFCAPGVPLCDCGSVHAGTGTMPDKRPALWLTADSEAATVTVGEPFGVRVTRPKPCDLRFFVTLPRETLAVMWDYEHTPPNWLVVETVFHPKAAGEMVLKWQCDVGSTTGKTLGWVRLVAVQR